jgi:hypothetical protein
VLAAKKSLFKKNYCKLKNQYLKKTIVS